MIAPSVGVLSQGSADLRKVGTQVLRVRLEGTRESAGLVIPFCVSSEVEAFDTAVGVFRRPALHSVAVVGW